MKPMIYGKERIIEVLGKGKEGEFYWVILSLGTHPCAYVSIPDSHPFFKIKNYDDIPVSCHGGITFMDKELHFQPINISNIKWIGWDYAHAGDWMGYYEKYPEMQDNANKKWTIEELKTEIMDVIKQLKEAEQSKR